MYNRFGFSVKKSDHRPSDVESRLSNINSRYSNSDQKSNFARPNQYAPLSYNEVSSLRKLSTGKPFNPNNGFGNAPSTIKSTREMSGSSAFSSVKKTGVTSKLFGMTPQNTKSFMQNRGSTSKISRTSTSGRQFKDNRPLSDPSFQRECQEKIYNFLAENDFPHQLTKQTLARPSLGDVSRIFEFLFSFFQSDIVIRNGPDTSLEVVVPKMMSFIGFPFPIKRSDLVSFSGGRQLGSLLSMLDCLIDSISYCQQLEVGRLMKKDFDIDTDEMDQMGYTNVFPKLLDIANEFENVTPDVRDRLDNLAQKIFGTEEDIDQMMKEEENLEQTLAKLEEEIDVLVTLPKKIQANTVEIESYENFIQEMVEHKSTKLRIENGLKEEIQLKEEARQKVIDENNKLKEELESQKDIQIDYRLAIDRSKQISEELDKLKDEYQNLKESFSTTSLEANNQKAKYISWLNDMDEVINEFFNNHKKLLLNRFLGDNVATFEQDKEWKNIYAHFKELKIIDIDIAGDEKLKEIEEFSKRLEDKFKDFKMKSLQHLSSLKGSISIDVMFKHQDFQRQKDKAKAELSEREDELQKMMSEKNKTEQEQTLELNSLNEQVESIRKKILSFDSKLSSINDDEKHLQNLEEDILDKENAIKAKKSNLMRTVKQKLIDDYSFYNQIKQRRRTARNRLEDENQKLGQILDNISNFNK